MTPKKTDSASGPETGRFKIAKCTPRAMKMYHEYGLDEVDAIQFIKNFMSVVTDEKKTMLAIDSICGRLPEDFNYEEMDVEEFRNLIFFFGLKSIGLSRG